MASGQVKVPEDEVVESFPYKKVLTTAVWSPEELNIQQDPSYDWTTQGWMNWNISLQPGMLATPVPSMPRPTAHHAFVSP